MLLGTRGCFRFLPVVVFLLLLTIPLTAQIAQTGNKGLLRTQSAQTLGKGFLGINASGYFSLDNKFVRQGLIIDTALKTAQLVASDKIKPTYMSTYYSLSYGLFSFWDLNLTLPFYVDNTNMVVPNGSDGSASGIGDLAFSMKIQYPPYEHSHIFDMTYFGEFYFPTAQQNKGLFPRQPYYTVAQNVKTNDRYKYKQLVDSLDFGTSDSNRYNILDTLQDDTLIAKEDYYYGARQVSFLAKMLWTFDASEINPDVDLKWHLNFGALFAGSRKSDNIFVLGSALQWTPHPVITLFTDFYGEARFTQLTTGFDLGKEPLILGSGVTFNIPGGAHITLAFDKCFSMNEKYSQVYLNETKNQAYKTKVFPDYGLSVSANWCGSIMGGDRDNDGIPDNLDKCPDEAEDVDSYEDYDGCPDFDNDHDGIPDIRDRCPNKPEDMDNFEDDDGCPDLDNDKDGITDTEDKCPNVVEDKDSFEDRDGCPDLDNDKDGIPDSLDKCANDPEDIDGFEDKDGCPDLDNDKDGLNDAVDKCPNEKENINAFQDEDGCPDVKAREIDPKIVLEGVNFVTGSAELTYESGAILDKQIESLVAYPDVCIEIRGHTDNVGQRVKNRELSLARAESVKAYMVTKGVNANRIKTQGMGPDEPIAPNTKAEGRAKNRRIEMYRVTCN